MKAALVVAMICLVVAGCGRSPQNRITFDGNAFSGSRSSERGDRAAFVARGGPASVSLEGARQAAAYQAVQHCIAYLGTSDVAWENGPDVADEELIISGNEVVLNGRCAEP